MTLLVPGKIFRGDDIYETTVSILVVARRRSEAPHFSMYCLGVDRTLNSDA